MQKKDSSRNFREYLNELTPFSEMCVNCIYFVRHYIHFDKDRYVPIDEGHCRKGRLKHRRACDICDKFVNKFYDDE